MAELWDEEVVEVRVASGKVVAVHRIKFQPLREVTMLCRRCGKGVVAAPDIANPWTHGRGGSIVCRDENGYALVPATTAAPTVWADGEVEF